MSRASKKAAESEEVPLTVAAFESLLNKSLDTTKKDLRKELRQDIDGALSAVMERVEGKITDALGRFKTEIMKEVENRLSEACTTFEERLGSFDQRAEEVSAKVTEHLDRHKAAVEEATRQAAAVNEKVTELQKTVITVSEECRSAAAAATQKADAVNEKVAKLQRQLDESQEREYAGRLRELRVSFTKAAAGQTSTEAQAFVRRLLKEKASYGGNETQFIAFNGTFGFKSKEIPGATVKIPADTPCWAVVLSVDSSESARAIMATEALKGTDKFVTVGRQLTPEERRARGIIRDHPAFKRAQEAYHASTGKWARWLFHKAELGRGDWWDLARVQALPRDA
jgi:uncharacterized phage infection (PIP) family protein YhgE